MPIEQKDVKYGCDNCNQGNVEFVELQKVSHFINQNEPDIHVSIYACPRCRSIYVQLVDEFFQGSFREESVFHNYPPYPQRNF